MVRLTDAFVRRLKAPPGPQPVNIWDDILPGLGLRISPRGKKAWHYRGRLDGKQRRFPLGVYPHVSLAQARGDAADLAALLARGRDPALEAAREAREARQAAENTFDELSQRYLAQHVAQLNSAREVERAFMKDLTPALGTLPVTAITRADLHKLLDAKALKSPIMANRLQSYLSRFFNWAVDREYVDTNPCHRMQRREDERRRRRDRVLTDDELVAIWHAAGHLGYPFGLAFKAMLLTGQRRGEVAGMAWSELDLEAATWTIPKERMKANAAHRVPLSPETVALLRSVPRIEDIDFVFTKIFSTKAPKAIVGFGKAKDRLDAFSGVTEWRLHDLRRTFATGCRNLGAERLTVSKLLHHTDTSVTAIYDRFDMTEAQQTAVDAWGNHVAKIIKKAEAN